ncbi:hypothetical protein SAMN05216559_1854 [Halomicrobium zhouii]|uniref:Uncharacterized protein n=1 Tax=Halomicrobium zhouii TaxID=767519 RepID=A0A1I6L1W5_9EURY|nr:hypothetical protein [Halomicrobium zhouii]SFR97441.1 hypothetical protein SAMN05216559_1854 [Halomicrobium zhouii]
MSSETNTRISRLLDRYRDLEPDRRQHIIKELERFRRHRVEGLVPYFESLVKLLRWESGPNSDHLAKLLIDCLSDHPDRIETETLIAVSELACSPEPPVRELGLKALRRLYEQDSEAIEAPFTSSEISDWMDEGADRRALAYRILGVTVADDAVEKLADAYSNEESLAKKASEAALEDIASISTSWLNGQDPLAGAKNLEHLAQRVPQIAVEQEAALREGLTADSKSVVSRCAAALIKLGYSEYGDQLDAAALLERLSDFDRVAAGRATGVCIGSQSAVDPDPVQQLLNGIEAKRTRDNQRVQLVALLEVSNQKPESVASYADRLRELNSGITGQARKYYIDLLGNIISHSENEGAVAPLLLEELNSTNDERVKMACKELSETNLYPLPQVVHMARNRGEEEISTPAHKIFKRSRPPTFDVADQLAVDKAEGNLEALESNLRYQTEPGRWDPVLLPAYERQRLATVRERFRQGKGGYTLLPHDVPEMGILAAAELALEGLHHDRMSVDIVVYSPGTSNLWGTFKDIQMAFRKFGLCSIPGITTAARPLDEVVTVSRVTDSGIKPWGEPASDNKIILTKSLMDIDSIDPDAVVCNFLGRRPSEFEPQLEEEDNVLESYPVFSLYPFTAKIEAPGTWPKYGYPESIPEATEQLLPGIPDQADFGRCSTSRSVSTPASNVIEQLRQLATDRSLTIERLETDEIIGRLKTMHRLAIELDGDETEQVARAFRKQTRFVQSLPVPLDTYDEWVREESTGRGRYASDPSHQRIDDMDSLKEDPASAMVPGAVYDYLTELRALFKILRRENPTYTRLLREIREQIDTEDRLAVLFQKRSMKQAFEYALLNDIGQTAGELKDRGVYILRPDELRKVGEVDDVIMTKPLAPSQTQFYMAPLFKSMQIIVYGENTSQYVSNGIEERLETLRARRELPADADWPRPPVVETISNDSNSDLQLGSQDGSDSELRQSEDNGAVEEIWTQFEPVDQSEAGSSDVNNPSTARPSAEESWKVQILTESGVELLKPSTESILVERNEGPLSGNQYVWTTAGDLEPGDNFLVIPDEVRDQVFEEALEAVYGDDMGGTDLVDGLEIWWETLRDIHSEYDDLETVYTLLSQTELEKSRANVVEWFRAVEQAEKPLDLPTNSDFRIGPNKVNDIKTIGKAFDYQDLLENATAIGRAMRLSRGESRPQGQELNELVISQLLNPSSDFARDVTEYSAGTIRHVGKQY